VKIRTHIGLSLDGFIAGPDGMPTWNKSPDFFPTKGASHGYPEFIEGCEAVIIGRATFDQGFAAPSWPWPGKPVFVLTSRPMPPLLPDRVVVSHGGPKEFIAHVKAAGLKKDAQLLGGGRTIRAFFDLGVIDELGIVTLPWVLGDGVPLWGSGLSHGKLTLTRTRAFPDGSVHAVYTAGS
jgi:dihydrofolate reductase